MLHLWEYQRSVSPSSVLPLYWLFRLAGNLVRLRTLSIANAFNTSFALFALETTIILLIFVLENVPKPRRLYSAIPTTEVGVVSCGPDCLSNSLL